MAGRFRLQTLLDLHAARELDAQVALAAALREADAAESLLSRMEQAIPLEHNQIAAMQRGAISVVLVQAGLQRLEFLYQAISAQSNVVQQRRAHVEVRRQTLVEISAHRRALEKLRDKAAAEQRRVDLRKETAALDEASSLRFQHQG